MSDALTPEIVWPEPPKGRYKQKRSFMPPPQSLANLRPAQKGEVRNPTGTNRLVRAQEAARREVAKRVSQRIPEVATALLDVASNPEHPRWLDALKLAFRASGFELEHAEREGAGGFRFTMTWEGPAAQEETPCLDVDTQQGP